MQIGLDVGYSHVKACCAGRRVSFPSVVGSPDRPSFSLGEERGILLQVPGPALVGEDAVEQSRFLRRREDRQWVVSEEWYCLALAAISELTDLMSLDPVIVTGLPVAFYSDKDQVLERLVGSHRIERAGRRPQLVHVTPASCRVIPQPFGAILAAALDEGGRIVDQDLATGRVGLIDVGGKTANILAVKGLREISHETTSVNAGAWDVVRAVRGWLNEHCPNLDLRDHQVVEAIIRRQVRYYGELLDLNQVVEAAVEPLAREVIAQASQLWNGGAALDAILIAGGGAHLLGGYIQQHFRHARVVDQPVFANAIGFWRYAQRLAGRV